MNENAGYKSKNLFSSHYLEKLIQKTPEWRKDEKNEQAFSRIKDIYTKKKDYLQKLSEPDLEREFIRPILDVLGHHFAVQETIHKKTRRPDYAFFPSEQIKRGSLKNLGKEDFYRQAVAIGDAKKWELPLDKDIKGKAIFENKNPSFQINTYLRETPPKWAILTNGRFWRIYYQDTSYKLDSYYEVDLIELLEKGNIENFKYFYLFFRLEAFLEDASGKNFLDRTFQESIDYAKELGESLQNNIYEALKILAEGFLIWPKNNLKLDEKTIEIVHDNCLILLYRLIFILYAESRGLLDITNSIYNKTYSLNGLKKEVADRCDRGEKFFTWSDEYWHRLKSLFALINEGSEARKIPEQELFIPSYNGGLFDPKRNEFLSETSIGDHYLTKVTDLLSRSNGSFVDYSTLDIRHIGSIYEGLLEYKLNIATQDLVAIKEKGKEKWIPKIEANGKKIYDKVKEGGLYLTTDKGERKATGSYYTPEYIVKYIVKNTLTPIVEEKLKKVRENGEKESDAILSINVLDPAMGSGHFLVESVDFLTTPFLDAVSHDVEKGLLPEEEYSTDWAKREIVSHCIYGVDLNPLSVELAKLSLWLKTIAKDKPLSFLDHRLKCGNSLIGVKLIDLPWYPKKKTDKRVQKVDLEGHKPFIKKLLETTRKLEEIRDDTLEQVKEKERIFEELKNTPEYIKIKTLADVNISLYFGNEIPGNGGKLAERRYGDFANWVYFGSPSDWENAKKLSWVKRSRETANEKRFFHWELEFPEVFYEAGKEKENPGFDVVIGNPPYVSYFGGYGSLDGLDKGYFSNKFNCGKGRIGTYPIFLEQSANLAQNKRKIGMIIPNTLLMLRSYEDIRIFLLEKSRIIYINNIAEGVFPEAEVPTMILIFEKEEDMDDIQNFVDITLEGFTDHSTSKHILQELFKETVYHSFNIWIDTKTKNLIDKIENLSHKLVEIADPRDGINPGPFKKILEVKDKKDEKHFKAIDGKDINQYSINWDGVYFNFNKELVEKLQKTQPNSLAVLGEKERFLVREKVILRQTADRFIGGLDTDQYFGLHSTYSFTLKEGVPYDLKYIIAILNSKLIDYYYQTVFRKGAKVFPQLRIDQLKQLPVFRCDKLFKNKNTFTTPPEERTTLVESLKSKYNNNLFNEILSIIDECLPKDKNGNFITEKEKSDVIHDFLAFLAEQMIEMSKEKNKEIQNFLDWLQREIKAEMGQLTNRTKLKAYYNLQFDAFLEILKKNKKKIPINLSNREFQTNLKKEFDESISKLKPLKEKIELTDNLADQIVYKLYALTDEEIRIVESSLSKKNKGKDDEK